jgi:hypothetical protein
MKFIGLEFVEVLRPRSVRPRHQCQGDSAGERRAQRDARMVPVLTPPVGHRPGLVSKLAQIVIEVFACLGDLAGYLARVFVHWKFS